MEILGAVVAFLGTAGLMGLFIFFMIQKQGWRLAQIVAGGIFALLLVSSFPQLPQAMNDSVTSIVKAFTK